MYYTIQNGDGTHYAPSQKIPLSDISAYGVYDSTREEFVIPFVAHWQKKTSETPINLTADVYLDDKLEDKVITVVPKGSSIYIDIDSSTMIGIMEKYNWQLFYDEIGSDPFISNISEENSHVELRLYSKFYVYNSGTDELELHTTKEAEKGTGENRYIDTVDFYSYHKSGFLYGGYYSDYSGKAVVQKAADDDNDHGTLTSQNIVDLSSGKGVIIADDLGVAYNPQPDEFTAPSWEWADAYQTRNMNPVEVPGSGPVYYIKEVPTGFLQNYVHYVYDWSTKNLVSLYPMCAIDDANYSAVGINFSEGAAEAFGSMYKLCKSLDFNPTTHSQSEGAERVIVSSTDDYYVSGVLTQNVFASKDVHKGYLAIWKDQGTVATQKNLTFTVQPYWTTPDNVTVTGITSQINTGDATAKETGISITTVG